MNKGFFLTEEQAQTLKSVGRVALTPEQSEIAGGAKTMSIRIPAKGAEEKKHKETCGCPACGGHHPDC